MAGLTSFMKNCVKFSLFNTRTFPVQLLRNKSDNTSIPVPTIKSKTDAPHDLWVYRKDKYIDARMLRDVKRRKTHAEYAALRPRIMALKRCPEILPPEIIAEADALYNEKIPRTTCQFQLTKRCALTSRPRGVVYRWRLSRFIFRRMIDYNTISGLQRAMW
ncbi:28S ribosomal protein S14, mitochondrial [Chelonus insularis]|uniref:28S ribosomal protein S14, mitochondrial n=1 Tax=Chelonus insularis TaxID=460826 RepID=UPI00158A84DB|nr:28S ribosomal protein S14, mitochondrial [Chelonus insularis]